MAYQEKDWQHDEYIVEQDLDRLEGNVEHVRAEMAVRSIFTDASTAGVSRSGGRFGADSARLEIYIGATLIGTVEHTGNEVPLTLANRSLSGSPRGLHTLELRLHALIDGDSNGYITRSCKVYLTDDQLFMSLFFSLRSVKNILYDNATFYAYLSAVTVLSHRIVQSW